MIESLKELNQICQKPRYREVGNWMVRHIVRDAALPVTWLLLHTKISANQVTLISILVAGLSMFCLAFWGSGFFFFSAALLQLWYLLDHVDGQVARYRKTSSLTGRFFDFMMHHMVHGSIFFALSFYYFNETANSFFLLWGFVTSLCMILFNLIHDVKYKTFFEKLKSEQINSSPLMGEDNGGGDIDPPSQPSPARGEGVNLKYIFSIMHKLSEMHVLMNVLTAAAIVQFFISLDLRFFLFYIYGIMVPFITVVKLSYLITQKKIDEEFAREFAQ